MVAYYPHRLANRVAASYGEPPLLQLDPLPVQISEVPTVGSRRLDLDGPWDPLGAGACHGLDCGEELADDPHPGDRGTLMSRRWTPPTIATVRRSRGRGWRFG